MKFPTMDEFAQNVAEKALDEIEINGKTIREWIDIIYATELGTDCISRQQAIDALTEYRNGRAVYISVKEAVRRIEQLLPAQLGTNLAEVGTDVPDINVGELISREQAIETFKDCAVNGVGIDGIVDALEQLPPANCSEIPNNSDTISRQAAIDLLKQMRKDGDMVPWEGKNVFARIRELPAEPHWIPVTERLPEEERECWITPKTISKVYRGVFTRHYGECHRTGFICDDGFMWLNTALAWMYCEAPEPYKEGD